MGCQGFRDLDRRWLSGLGALLMGGSAVAEPLAYSPVRTANPLKGFMPFSRDFGPDVLPHSMEFFYLPLKDLMDGPESFTWQPLDARLDAIAGRGNQSVFRVYLDYPKKEVGTPDFLRHGPDGIAGTADDLEMRSYEEHGNAGVSLSPDYSDVFLRRALMKFIEALGERYDGDPRIGFLQIGLLGFWGEWHTFPHGDWLAPLAIQEEILGAFDAALKHTPLLVREPKAAAFRNYRIGYHDDSFGYTTLAPPGWHLSARLEEHGETECWKTRPIGGEIRPEIQPGMWENPSSVPEGQEFERCVEALHASWMLANAAFVRDLSPAARVLAEKQSRMLGYEFFVSDAAIDVDSGEGTVRISARVRNTGVAPFYHEWPLEIAVLDEEGRIFFSARPGWRLSGLLPGDPERVWSGEVGAEQLPTGNCTLLLRVVNPLEGGKPLRFANMTQDADLGGWLTVGEWMNPMNK